LGGDRIPEKTLMTVALESDGQGFLEIRIPDNKQLITFHPQPPNLEESKLVSSRSMVGFQYASNRSLSHSLLIKNCDDLALTPIKPTLDGELVWGTSKMLSMQRNLATRSDRYQENNGTGMSCRCRRPDLCCHAVWQMYDLDKTPVKCSLKAMESFARSRVQNQVRNLKSLMLSPTLIFDEFPDRFDCGRAAR